MQFNTKAIGVTLISCTFFMTGFLYWNKTKTDDGLNGLYYKAFEIYDNNDREVIEFGIGVNAADSLAIKSHRIEMKGNKVRVMALSADVPSVYIYIDGKIAQEVKCKSLGHGIFSTGVISYERIVITNL